MDRASENRRDRLLAQYVPEPDKLARYRKGVEMVLERNEKLLRREKWYATILWIVLVATWVPFLVYGGYHYKDPGSTFWAAAACVWFIFGATELLKHFINRSRVELLKELKQVELQVLELRELIGRRTTG
jgi:hypothetical protein